MMNEPVCTALIFADRIIIENNGKKGIIGTFSKLYSQNFPVQSAPFAIYASVTNLYGKYNFQINLIHEETNESILPISGEIDSKSTEDMIELVFNLNTVLFNRDGKYSLILEINKELLASIFLYVEKMKSI